MVLKFLVRLYLVLLYYIILGSPNIILVYVVCIAFNFSYCLDDTFSVHAVPAYIDIEFMYIFRKLNRFLVGIGLDLFSKGYVIPRTLVISLTKLDTCLLKFSF